MIRAGACLLILAAAVARQTPGASAPGAGVRPLTIDYPAEGSLFPPEFPAPAFQWRDADDTATAWVIEVEFADGSASLAVKSKGERMKIGDLDPTCVGAEPPRLSPEQAAAHVWRPDAAAWSIIKQHSTEHPATLTITGLGGPDGAQRVSRGQVRIQTSKDPVGAPIFYRDVPLLPSPTEKGVIKPLPSFAIQLIKWRVRDIAQTQSITVMEGLPTCANCHSFSRDGKTLGLDVDGPQNDKGLYALVPVSKQMSIRNEDVIRWSSFRDEQGYRRDEPAVKRFGFMSQVSPDGKYVVTTIENPGARSRRYAGAFARGLEDRFYNAGYRDYTFGQVFYPTRGILAWYSKDSGKLEPLPGADDPRYVQSNAVWSPDGEYLIFARAPARDPYSQGQKMAEYANDPNETQIQYELYRIPFNQGRGGTPEPVEGAGANGMSNNFPKVSPDGRWIVFVQCRNGLLMRPDSQLYIVPAPGGGAARRLRSNTPRMNSWHSFSPNGRWLVFSSKSPSPYTQMYLTHIDEDGNDSPAILIENATAANRAVNIPEFVNIPPDGIARIDAPATEFYRLFDVASELGQKGQLDAAIATWRQALALSPDDAKAHSNLGVLLERTGRTEEAIAHYRKAVEVEPDYPHGYTNLGVALARAGKVDQAIAYFEKALQLTPRDADAHANLGGALAEAGRLEEAIAHCQKALELNPEHAQAHGNIAIALAKSGKAAEAIPHFEKALAADPDSAAIHANLAEALAETGAVEPAIPHFRAALAADPDSADLQFNLGRALATLGRFAEAIPYVEKAARGNQPAIAAALAGLYARAGRPDDALRAARQALRLATEQNDPDLMRLLSANIAAYEKAHSGVQDDPKPAAASPPRR